MSNEDVQSKYGCSCAECTRKYHEAKAQRDPYYRNRERPREQDPYDRCRRDPYARDPDDKGGAGW